MKLVKKVVEEAPADRESLIASIIEMRFPEYLDAEEAIACKREDKIAFDGYPADRESWRTLEQELENIARTKWSEDLGLTASQHEALRAALTLAKELKAMRLNELKLLYEQAENDENERGAFFNKGEARADFHLLGKGRLLDAGRGGRSVSRSGAKGRQLERS